MSKKKHPHKRSIPVEQRKEIREAGKAWWLKESQKPSKLLSDFRASLSRKKGS